MVDKTRGPMALRLNEKPNWERAMVHGYHAIFGTYGFWLPNDPRGSWSDFVGAWELVRFGKPMKSLTPQEITPRQERER